MGNWMGCAGGCVNECMFRYVGERLGVSVGEWMGVLVGGQVVK